MAPGECAKITPHIPIIYIGHLTIGIYFAHIIRPYTCISMAELAIINTCPFFTDGRLHV